MARIVLYLCGVAALFAIAAAMVVLERHCKSTTVNGAALARILGWRLTLADVKLEKGDRVELIELRNGQVTVRCWFHINEPTQDQIVFGINYEPNGIEAAITLMGHRNVCHTVLADVEASDMSVAAQPYEPVRVNTEIWCANMGMVEEEQGPKPIVRVGFRIRRER